MLRKALRKILIAFMTICLIIIFSMVIIANDEHCPECIIPECECITTDSIGDSEREGYR